MSDAKVEFTKDYFDEALPGEERFFGFKCPKHSKNRCDGLPIRGLNGNGDARPSWIWDGNREQPTFSPSIDCHSCPGKWHGFIENGRCVSTNKVDEPEPV